MEQALSGAVLFDGDTFIEDHGVICRDGQIEAVLPSHQLPADVATTKLESGILAPGFIDTQVNGGGGVLFNNAPSCTTLATMVQAHRATGTTGMLPTLISDTREVLCAGAGAVQRAVAENLPGILGLHIEGPFFNPARRGTHNEQYLHPPSSEEIDWLCSLRGVKVILTLAPEQTRPGQIKTLSDAGILVCAGHSDARGAEIRAALEEGLVGFTHLYNAMRPLQSREPGVVGAALDDPDSWCGIIVDGHHVDPVSVRVALAAKPAGKMILVTDAMATVGSDDKSFQLYGETICETGGRLVNAEGRLAGSAIGMLDAVRISCETVGVALEESLRMASLYPAGLLQLDRALGRLRPGYRADMVHFDARGWRVHNTWIAGEHCAH
ncbi:N-acetylglucosamine-6-phosphate deacetylase [Exilibacterium tricleocarpae]|uniref:N-acetylglucosamine-6-phosphate deacetylase n=1 Tax=Exilibacterium tricleocarpae TaxID=2591008 RepID=A0A545TP33_9GAMM|nr:N-acetylglucosamine-6-phosphate deacetylase [Exilibacterium tricleocarpae]TQV78931.1 N-acetylglucosamine-6-phosphate deacetylase [Exilibacterium tricleocarpae]